MNATPTEGPYHIEYDGASNPIITTGKHGRLNVLAHIKTPNDPNETEANAVLLAASWEMREKLTWAANILVDGIKKEREHIMRDIRALLARIDGTENL